MQKYQVRLQSYIRADSPEEAISMLREAAKRGAMEGERIAGNEWDGRMSESAFAVPDGY